PQGIARTPDRTLRRRDDPQRPGQLDAGDDVVGPSLHPCLPDLLALAQRGEAVGLRADLGEDPGRPLVGVGQAPEDRGVVALVLQEPAVETQTFLEQLLPQQAEVAAILGLEQLALADAVEEAIDGLPRQPQIGLRLLEVTPGPVALVDGLDPAGLRRDP